MPRSRSWIQPAPPTSKEGAKQRVSLRDRRLRCECLEDRRVLAVITVDSGSDLTNGDTSSVEALLANDGGDGVSLREALEATNATPGSDEVVFSTDLSGVTVSLDGEELVITDPVTIDARGLDSNPVIDAQGLSRVIYASETSGDVTLAGLTITGGRTGEYYGIGAGGGVRHTGSMLTITDSRIAGNHTEGRNASGGGVAAGIVHVENSVFADNETNGYGSDGGALSASTLVIRDSEFVRNQTAGDYASGGAVQSFTLTVHTSTFDSNRTLGKNASGGAIRHISGPATISDAVLVANYTESSGSSGGAISSTGYGTSDLLVENTTIAGNHTKGDSAQGGGLYASTKLQLLDSTVADNRTEGDAATGGGFYASDEAFILRSELSGNSTSGNRSGGGGGFLSQSDGLTRLVASEISGNSTTGANSAGGGLLVGRGEHFIERSTISGNSTSGPNSSGGGLAISSFQAEVSIAQTTVTNNSVSNEDGEAGGLWLSSVTATVTDSVLAGNSASSRYADLRAYSARLTVSHSLIGEADGSPLVESSTPDSAGNLVGSSAGDGLLDPGLGVLADNGGPTRTHALLPASPGIDAGDPSETLRLEQFDQRGESFLRVSGGRIDIGSFESQLNVFVVDTAIDDFDGNHQPGDLSLREAIQLANETAGRDLIAFDPSLSGKTLMLARGEFEITESLVIDASALPERPTIDARLRSRIFNIAETSEDIVLRGMNLTGGSTSNHPDPLTESGGAIRSESTGLIHLRDTTLSGNHTSGAWARGGAIFVTGDLHLVQSTISGNRTEGEHSSGGAIAAYGRVTLEQSTITANHATAETATGGGVWGAWGGLTLEGSILAGNTAGAGKNDLNKLGTEPLTARYSLVGDSNGPSGPDNPLVSALASGQGNLFSTAGQVDARLAPLADNGGGALTHALLAESPATNAGESTASNGFDQRGTPFARVAEGRIDLGSYETQALALRVDNLADEFDADYSEGQLSLREAVVLANRNPGLDTITFAPSLSGQTLVLANGEIEITDDLAIDGAGLKERLTIDAQRSSRIFNFTAETGDLTISRLTLTGGLTTGNNPRVDRDEEPVTTHSGGAIRFGSLGRLTLQEATLADSRTSGRLATGGSVFARSEAVLIRSVLTGNSTQGDSANGGGLWSLNGPVTLEDSFVTENYTFGYSARGGGIGSSRGHVTIASSEVRANYTSQNLSPGGGISGGAGVTITDSLVADNSTRGQFVTNGGGIAGDQVVITRSHVTGNYNNAAFGRGGGVLAEYLTSSGSTFRGNYTLGESSYGGAIHANGLVLDSSTVAENRTEAANSMGGGLSVRGPALIANSTISGNHAAGFESRGGGLFHTGSHPLYDTLRIEQSTITNNTASRGGGIWDDWQLLEVTGSILAANVADEAPDLYVSTDAATSLDHSLFGDNAGTPFVENQQPDEEGNLIGSATGGGIIDPILAPLADNGGQTLTHALLPTSPAIEAGDPQAPSGGYDQRGEPFDRIAGQRIDIGAFEALTIYVDTAIDEDDSDHSPGDLSLREAIGIANAAPGVDVIRFDADLSGRSILLDGEELVISDAVAIDASALELGLTINAQSRSRVLAVSEVSGDVSLSGLTLTGGLLEGYPYRPYFNSYGIETSGGAIRSLSEAELKLTNVTISGNQVEGYQSRGGGIFSHGPLTLLDSEVSDNRSEGRDADGGGVYASGSLRVESSAIQRNRTEGLRASGGGVHSVGDTELINSSVTGNSTAGQLATGGGINSLANLSATGSQLSDNYTTGASSQGGGASVAGLATFTSSLIRDNRTEGSDSSGGGVQAESLALIQSTVSGNYTVGYVSVGGGLASDGETTLTQSTIVDNHALSPDASGGGVASAGVLSLDGTVVAENTSGSYAPDLWTAVDVGEIRFSFVGDRAGTELIESVTPDASGNRIGDSDGLGVLEPRLGPLAQNGGLFASHRPLSGSPLIDAGDQSFDSSNSDPPLLNDVRGPLFPRVIGGRIDIGAVEETGIIVVDSLSGSSDGDLSAGQLSIREATALANASPGHDTITFAADLAGETILLGGAELLFTEAVNMDATSLEGGITLDAEQQSRVINLNMPYGDSTLAGLHLTRGLTTESNRPFPLPIFFLHDGGAVRSVSTGDLTLDRMRITDSGIEGSYTYGGGVHAKGHVRVFDSIITGNRSAGWQSGGGGVHAPSVTVKRSTVSDNYSQYSGGGISGNQVTIESSTLSANSAGVPGSPYSGANGGAVNASQVTIAGSVIEGNSAARGGAIHAGASIVIADSDLINNTSSSEGGAAYSRGDFRAERSDFVGNDASRGGGAVYADSVSILDSNFAENAVGGRSPKGGALLVVENAIIVRSLFDQNQTFGPHGGGGAISGPNLTIEQSTFSDNRAEQAGDGGAILATEGLVVTTSTFSGNRAVVSTPSSASFTRGGAISFFSGDFSIRDSTFVGNEAPIGGTLEVQNGSVQVEGSIITDSQALAIVTNTNSEVVINHSLLDTRVTPTAGEGNVFSDSALLGPLADNGGPTPTHIPMLGSPAIDAGDASILFDSEEFDQRGEGFFRVAGPRIDMGAAEIQAAAPALTGDFNGDGVVDAADYTVWRDAVDTTGQPYAGSDGDGDGQVTAADLVIWRSNYGATLTDTSDARVLIEPATVAFATAEVTTVKPVAERASNPRQNVRASFFALPNSNAGVTPPEATLPVFTRTIRPVIRQRLLETKGRIASVEAKDQAFESYRRHDLEDAEDTELDELSMTLDGRFVAFA